MKKVDYLIIGFGIAGACFAKKCIENGKTFQVITDQKASASQIAAGMFNPIVLFRFVAVDDAIKYMNQLKKTFTEFESLLNAKFLHQLPVYRIFADAKEPQIWKEKIQQNDVLSTYLNPEIIHQNYKNIDAPFGFGEVLHTGWLDMNFLIEEFQKTISENILFEEFNYWNFDVKNGIYKDIQAENVVFAEGCSVENNPWFNYVPIIKNKGETLIVEIKDELPKIVFKSKNFLMPIKDNLYYVGTTYDRDATDATPTEQAKNLLLKKLKTYFKGDAKVLEHKAAFRPTLLDRRGVIGIHPKHKKLFILNGMGTRGTFHAPYLSEQLFNLIENNSPIDAEHDVARFIDLF